MANILEISFGNGVGFLTKLRASFYALVCFPLLAFLLLYLGFKKGTLTPLVPAALPVFYNVLPVLTAVLMPAIYWFYFARLKKVRAISPLRAKLSHYFRLKAVKFILLGAIGLLQLAAYWMTGHPVFAGLYMLVFVLTVLNNPSLFTMLNDLKPGKVEEMVLRNNEDIE